MTVRVREDREGLVALGCTACGTGLLVPLEDVRDLRLWHYGDGSHRLVTLDGRPIDPVPMAAERRAHLLGLAVRLQDVADDLAEQADRG